MDVEGRGAQAADRVLIKKVDELLTARIDAVQHTNGLTRLGWQALNLIQEAAAPSRDEVTKTLQPFADAATIDQALDGLVDQGLVRSSSGLLELTAEGAKLHQRALESQKTVRHRAVEGIDGADYATLCGLQQRLVRELSSW